MALKIVKRIKNRKAVVEDDVSGDRYILNVDAQGSIIIPPELSSKKIKGKKISEGLPSQIISLPTTLEKSISKFSRSKILENVFILSLFLLSVVVIFGEYLINLGSIDLWLTKINVRAFFLGNDTFISLQIIFHFIIYLLSILVFIKFLNYIYINFISIKQIRDFIGEIEEELKT